MVSKHLSFHYSLFNPLCFLREKSMSLSKIIGNDLYNQTEILLNDSSSFISCNFTRLYDVSDVQKASIGLIITYCVSLFFVLFIGCPLYLAIVHYEHFGEDSQKRSLANMTFTNICIFVIMLMTMIYFGIGIRITFGPMFHWLAHFFRGTIVLFSSCIAFSLLFSIVLKNSQLFKPSLTTSFNDNTLYIVVSFGTLTISAFPAYWAWFNDENELHIMVHFFSGDLSHLYLVKPKFSRLRSLSWIQEFFQGVVASGLTFNIVLYFVLKIVKMPKKTKSRNIPKTTQTISLNNMARNPMVMETTVVLLVFVVNLISDVLTTHWIRHLASKPETFNLSPIPCLLQTLVVGFLNPLFFFSSNKKLRGYAANEFFQVNISRKETKIIPVIKVTDSSQNLGQLDFQSTKMEEFAEDFGKEFCKTIITHMDCKDCLEMPSTSSQTVLLCSKHQKTEKSVQNMETEISFDEYIKELAYEQNYSLF